MSALSTPGGGGTTAQSKPTSGKQKYQKLDINSLYCANRNENSEPSSVKSQLSRKHGMQSLGKVPSARRPPANLPSLKTETGQDPNANSISATATTVSTPPTCTSQTITTTSTSSAAAGVGSGGWVALPPPSSPHFRTEFPSLEAAAQPSHRAEHSQPQAQLRPQAEGSWTSGGGAGPRQDSAPPVAQQPPTFRTILPSFLMKGSSGRELSLGALGSLPRARSARPAPRGADVLTARPILRDDQISSLDDIAHDAGWATHDDIDYNQKLDFSDGESTAPVSKSSNNNNKNRASIENERVDSKNQEPGDEDQLWAERRQKQSNEVAQAVARAKQRKEEEQRRQLRDTGPQNKDPRDRDRNDNRDREDSKEKERLDRPDHRQDNRERDRNDKDRNDRENRDRERVDNRDRMDNRDRFDNRDRDRDRTDRDRNRMDNRDRESDKERMDTRERDRNDNRDRDRFERDRERERNDRDRNDRDFRERGGERDYRDREREQNPAFSKQFQANIPPRFLKQQQSRQQDDHKGWAFQNKPAPRRNEPAYTAPRHAPHNGRRSYSRDYSDREDEFRREKDGPGAGPQWRSEMQDYDRPGRELDRSNSKESYKDYDYKDKRNELERKPSEVTIDQNSRTAADKLSEVFERKSIGLIEPFAQPAPDPAPAEPLERQTSKTSLRDSAERDFGKTSWADMAQEEQSNFTVLKPTLEKVSPPKEEPATKPAEKDMEKNKISSQPAFQASLQTPNIAIQNQNKYHNNNAANNQNFPLNQQVSQSGNLSTQSQPSISENLSSKPNIQSVPKVNVPENISYPKCIETPVQQQNAAKIVPQKTEKEFTVVEPAAPKPTSAEPIGPKPSEVQSQPTADAHATDSKRPDDKRAERLPADAAKGKDGVERKSSGSGSEKKGRGYGAGGGYAVYSNRGWGAREPRGRRHRAPASESDASTDGAPERRRRAPREPRAKPPDALEPFAPRGQPSRRGRGGSFAGAPRPPAPAKRVAGYGPPNTKSPFGQASRVRDDEPPAPPDDKRAKPRAGSGGGRGRRARAPSGEDDNWETTSEHSEGGAPVRRRPPAAPHKGGGGRAPGGRGGSGRSGQAAKKEPSGEKAADIAEAMTDLKITAAKKEEEVVDDGFQEVRNKKNSKDSRGPSKDEAQNSGKTSRSHSNQGGARNGSSTRSSSDKSGQRAAPATGKPAAQYERPRQANLAPRFVKQRQKQQLGLATPFGPDTGAAPPPPAVNAWDKPIAQSLRTPPEEPPPEPVAPPAPPARESPAPTAPPTAPLPQPADKAGVLDGATPPVETIIFENTNYKTAPPAEALKQKYQPAAAKPAEEALTGELALSYNGEARRPRSLQELMAERPADDAALGLQMAFDAPQKPEDSSDMKLDFAFDSDLGQLEEKAGKALGLPRTHAHLSAASTISPLAADLNLKIASVKKVWEMPAVAEGGEELQFGFEEAGVEAGAPPNVCKVKPTQQLQSPPPPAYPGAVGLVGGYGGLSVPSPPAVLYGSGQQGGLYGAFLDQGRQQFGPFPGAPYAAQSAAPYNYQPPPDMFQSLPSQYRMQYPAPAAAGGGAAFGQSAPLANNPSTVLISSTSNSLMSATVKPSSQIGAIGSKGAGVGGVGGVNTYQQQYLGYSAPDAYSLPGLLPRPAPPASSYYSYQGPSPAPSYPLQFPQQQNSFGSQYLSSQLQVAAAVQQMQQQYRAPMQQQYGPPQQAVRPPAQQLKSPLHEHANGFAPLCDAASPTPGKNKPKPPHSPPHHKYQHVPHPHHHHQQQQ